MRARTAPREAMARKRRNRQVNDHGTNLVTRGSTATSKAVNVTKMDVTCVAKQLKQIQTKAATTVVGILFDKQHEKLCTKDNMSKNMAFACIEESLTSASKNAHPVLDFQSHKLNTALARASLGWDTPGEAAVGLHRELAKELENGSYSDLHHGSSLNDYNFQGMEIHSTGENLTAAEMQQLFVMSALPESLHDSGGSIENNDTDADDYDRSDTDEKHSDDEMTKKNSEHMNMNPPSTRVLADPATNKTRP